MEQTDFEKHEQIIYFSDNFTTTHDKNEMRLWMEVDGTMSDTPQEHVQFFFLPSTSAHLHKEFAFSHYYLFRSPHFQQMIGKPLVDIMCDSVIHQLSNYFLSCFCMWSLYGCWEHTSKLNKAIPTRKELSARCIDYLPSSGIVQLVIQLHLG